MGTMYRLRLNSYGYADTKRRGSQVGLYSGWTTSLKATNSMALCWWKANTNRRCTAINDPAAASLQEARLDGVFRRHLLSVANAAAPGRVA